MILLNLRTYAHIWRNNDSKVKSHRKQKSAWLVRFQHTFLPDFHYQGVGVTSKTNCKFLYLFWADVSSLSEQRKPTKVGSHFFQERRRVESSINNRLYGYIWSHRGPPCALMQQWGPWRGKTARDYCISRPSIMRFNEQAAVHHTSERGNRKIDEVCCNKVMFWKARTDSWGGRRERGLMWLSCEGIGRERRRWNTSC